MGRIFSRAIGMLFALLFIVLASFSACTSAFRLSLIDIDTYKQTLVEQNFYADIIPYIIPGLLENSRKDLNTNMVFAIDLNDIDRFMSVDNWRSVSDQLVPSQWLQTQTESLLDSVARFSRGDFSQRENVIEITEIIERLQGEEGKQASAIIIDSAPDCTAQQINQLRLFDSESDSLFPICHPPDILKQKAVNVISDWFYNLGTIIRLELQQRDNILTIPEDAAQLIHNLFLLDSQFSLLLLLCPLSIIGLIIIFAVRSLKSFGRWLGWTFIIAGIVTLVLIFTSQAPVFASFDDVVTASTEVERFEAQIYAGFIRSVYADASATMLVSAGIMIGIGFILLVISVIGKSSFLVPEGSILVTGDGRVISTTQAKQQTKTITSDDP